MKYTEENWIIFIQTDVQTILCKNVICIATVVLAK